jgi:hypothetical protein
LPWNCFRGDQQEEIAEAEARKKAMGINEPALSRFTPAEIEAKLQRIGFQKRWIFRRKMRRSATFKVGATAYRPIRPFIS